MPPDFTTLLNTYGWPTAILIILCYAIRKVWLWAKPFIESMFQAYIARQKEISQSMKDLANQSIELSKKTISIQESVQKSVESIPGAIEKLLRATTTQTSPPNSRQ